MRSIDPVNELYEFLFGSPKSRTWLSLNDWLPNTAPGTSLFSITPIDPITNLQNRIPPETRGNQNSNLYIAVRQGSDITWENRRFYQSASRYLSSAKTFHDLGQSWNGRAEGATHKYV